MLGCSALTSYNAISKAKPAVDEGHVVRGEGRLLVVGAGGLGLWGLQWAKQLLPPNTKVAVADVSEEKLAVGKAAGADIGLLWERGAEIGDMAQRVRESFGGPVDAAIDFVGAATTTAAVQKSIRKAAHHVMVGLAGPTISLPLFPFIHKMGSLLGVYVGSQKQLAELLEIVATGKIQAPPVKAYKPEELGLVLEMLAEGSLHGRALLKFI